MNILLCSVGRRVKLVEYFKTELNKIGGNVVAVDCNPTAPALYNADACEIVPKIDDPGYLQVIKKICKEYSINAVLSLIDPELPILTSFKEEMEKENISVIVSDKSVIDVCFDKYLTSLFLHAHNIPSVPTYRNMCELESDIKNGIIDFPLIIKPRKGSASNGIQIVNSLAELRIFEIDTNDLIVQPYIRGEEFGVDCYVDLINNQLTNIFIKQKLAMRSGETDKSISMKVPSLKAIIEKLITALKPSGPIDIDCFKTESGYVVSEINPRFGGGYPHAHEMGQNFVKNIINNLKGNTNISNNMDYHEGAVMVKYDHVKIIGAEILNTVKI